MTVVAGNAANSGERRPPATKVAVEALRHFRIYQHSHLIYWWPVWLYGFICAGLTYFQGIPVIVLDKTLLYHPSPWLALILICLIIFVITFTTVKARGIYSYVLIMILGALFYGLPKASGFESVAARLPDLRIHLNLAFYLTFSIAMLALWSIVLFVDRFSWLYFQPGRVTEEHRFGQQGSNAFSTAGAIVRHLPDDFFRHKILGLWFFGLGTGDFTVTPHGRDSFELVNVFHPRRKLSDMQAMITLVPVASQGPSN